MKLWRVCRRAFAALDGEGARLYGGRWNSEGGAVVYLSTSLPLAILEYLVHVEVGEAPSDLVALEVDLPEATSRAECQVGDLPSDWNTVSDHPACVDAGDAWIAGGRVCLFFVPSAVVPSERNVLLNPAHPEARAAKVTANPLVLDRRLLG